MSGLVGIHHPAVTVGDLDASAGWYANLLGFEEVFREDGPGRPVGNLEALEGWAARLAEAGALPEPGTHVLDQPLLLVAALRSILADSDHCDPRRRSTAP